MALSTAGFCFFALEPDEGFAAQVRAYKQRTAELAGPQRFLDDPPHVTVYLAAFHSPQQAAKIAAGAVRRLQAPEAAIRGWHVFRDDALTGGQTLVCDIDAASRPALSRLQQDLVETVAPARDRQATRARYESTWQRLSELERSNVATWGFPFLGTIWHPHVTIASIRTADWNRVWPVLADTPPTRRARFPRLGVYALEAERPALVQRFELERPT